MSLEHVLHWLPIIALIAILIAARVRAWMLRRRGQRVVVIDWHRPLAEVLYDTLLLAGLLCWLYFLIAETWPRLLTRIPAWLTANIVTAMPVRIVGAAMVLAGPILFTASLRSFANSWRIGIDRNQPPPLVTAGVFGWTRNPIYTAFDLIIIGTFLIHGRVIFLLLGIVLVLMIHGVVMREERFLDSQFGDAFRGYCRNVRRYGLL
jgi:protein-S-isoprenylcysteine O-methyltransferase Ste14